MAVRRNSTVGKVPIAVGRSGDSLPPVVHRGDMEWLTSGLRRDICVLLYGEETRAQTLKSELEARYDRRLKPDRFYGAVDALESSGFVEKHVEGLEDVYSLTDAGENAVDTQFEWMRDRLEDSVSNED
jgi:DNA-binding PadR family transcriptional regulator